MDGWHVIFTNWGDGEPSDPEGTGGCVCQCILMVDGIMTHVTVCMLYHVNTQTVRVNIDIK